MPPIGTGTVHVGSNDATASALSERESQPSKRDDVVYGLDAVVAAVGRELDAPVVSADSTLTEEATKRVVDVEAYL